MADDAPASAAPAQTTTAPRRPAEDFQFNEMLPMLLILGSAILLLGAVFWLGSRWRKSTAQPMESTLTLTNYREMYDEGEITKEEYERIREKMAKKMKSDLGVSPPPGPPPKSE